MDKIPAFSGWLSGGFSDWISHHSVQEVALVIGATVAVTTLFINLITLLINLANFFLNWHYRKKKLRLQQLNKAAPAREREEDEVK